VDVPNVRSSGGHLSVIAGDCRSLSAPIGAGPAPPSARRLRDPIADRPGSDQSVPAQSHISAGRELAVTQSLPQVIRRDGRPGLFHYYMRLVPFPELGIACLVIGHRPLATPSKYLTSRPAQRKRRGHVLEVR
jgi:hypothetical protein